jgi:hypothetical protein
VRVLRKTRVGMRLFCMNGFRILFIVILVSILIGVLASMGVIPIQEIEECRYSEGWRSDCSYR